MKTNTAIRIFLASPMDVVDERKLFRNTISKINETIAKNLNVFFEVVGWEEDVIPNSGIDAQDVVNSQIREAYDIFVGIFKSRIGTKTHRSISGSVEEYENAKMRKNADPNLRIMCYFLDADEEENQDISDLKIRMNEDGVLYSDRLDSNAFAELVFRHFSNILLQYAKTLIVANSRPSPLAEKSAVSVAILMGKNVLIVRRSPNSTVGAGMWQIPGGKVEANEAPSDAAVREIQEELSITLEREKIRHISTIKTKDLKRGGLINLTLYMYQLETTITDKISLNSENDRWDFLDIQNIPSDSRPFLGYNKQFIAILWRELMFAEPLQALLDQMRDMGQDTLPESIGNYSSLETNYLYSFLSLLGLIDFRPLPVFVSNYSARIIEEMIGLSRFNKSIFENSNVDDLRDLQLPNNELPNLQKHRERMLFSHKSLMSVLSCRVPLKNSIRNIADLLFFAECNNEKYLLLRWDFYAKKYQLISSGIDPDICQSSEEKAKTVIIRRFSDVLSHLFDYHDLMRIQTQHFSAGSIENDPILRKYVVDVLIATPKRPNDTAFVEFLNTINTSTELSTDYCWDFSDDQLKNLAFYQWCRLDDLLDSNTCYDGRKVQGFEELITKLGRKTIIECSNRCLMLSSENVSSNIGELIEKVDSKAQTSD